MLAPTHVGNQNFVFGLSAIASSDLLNQHVQAYNVTYGSDKVTPIDSSGNVIDAFYFNKVMQGDFELLRLTSSYVTFDEPGDTASVYVLGTPRTVIIESLKQTRMPNDVVKDTFSWVHYPSLSAT